MAGRYLWSVSMLRRGNTFMQFECSLKLFDIKVLQLILYLVCRFESADDTKHFREKAHLLPVLIDLAGVFLVLVF